MTKIITAARAAEMIEDRDTVAISGNGAGMLEPTVLIGGLAERFHTGGRPRDLTLIHAGGMGDRKNRGLSPLAQKGLLRRIIGGYWATSPALCQMALQNEIAAYNLPMGIISRLYRTAAAGLPGLISRAGLHTFVDPRLGGGKLNPAAEADLVRLTKIDAEEYLFYTATVPDVCFIRAGAADENGYLSMEDEVACFDVLDMAMAAHNHGGLVIAQVGRVLPAGSIHPKDVVVPGYLVDALVVAEGQEPFYGAAANSVFISGDKRYTGAIEPLPLDQRKIIARRAFQELHPGSIATVGVGVADGIAYIAHEEGVDEQMTLITDTGISGGISLRGDYFGAVFNSRAAVPMPAQFDFFEGGGADLCFLGFGEFDAVGNVNVSRLGGRLVGVGGFIEISQFSKKAVFCGTLTSGGLQTKVTEGGLQIVREGKFRKCPVRVAEVGYNGEFAQAEGRTTLFITERAVFRLSDSGITLCEYAPGVDIEKDILANMEFQPDISPQLKEMDRQLFLQGNMGFTHDWYEGVKEKLW